MTERQLVLLDFIADFIKEYRFSPSVEEMRVALGLRSKAGVHRMLIALEKQGKITHHKYMARTVEVVQ